MYTELFRDHLVSGLAKGVPDILRNMPIGDVGVQGINILKDDLPTPFAVIKETALQFNIELMAQYTAALGVDLAPHGKTTMSPEIFERQLKAGAWAITCATGAHLRSYRAIGVPRIIMANQMLDSEAIQFVAREMQSDPAFEFYAIVDSIEGVNRFVAALDSIDISRPIKLLVEVGIAGGRTGARSVQKALEIVQAIKSRMDILHFAGAEAYEGVFSAPPEVVEGKVEALMAQLSEFATQCDELGLIEPGPFMLSAGGSAYFDMVVRALKAVSLSHPTHVVIRSGCYVTHDHGFYAAGVERLKTREDITGLACEMFSPALEIWAAVQSCPEEGLALLTVGKRDVSFDLGLPIVLKHFDRASKVLTDIRGKAEIVGLNDHHGYMRTEGLSDIKVGDLICLGISHPCTTFDRWQYMYLAKDNYDIIGAVRTCFDG